MPSTKPILRLRGLHRRLDHEIEAERRLLRPDASRLMRLKKLKLGLKDRIHRLEVTAEPQPA